MLAIPGRVNFGDDECNRRYGVGTAQANSSTRGVSAGLGVPLSEQRKREVASSVTR
jgi:hypothetical protein